jgi:cytochrome c553
VRIALLAIACGLLISGCDLRQRMFDQPRYEALEASDFFEDGQSSRMPIEGTIARGHLRLDAHLYEGKVNGELATTVPFEVTEEFLLRGQQRFDIYCSPCHDQIGRGNGVVVQRGLKKQPPSYHEQRLVESPIGHFFDVSTNGFGAMYSYASRVSVHDRWAIAAYIRALQLSQRAKLEDLPAEDRKPFE